MREQRNPSYDPEVVREVLAKVEGNKSQAAKLLGVPRGTARRWFDKLELGTASPELEAPDLPPEGLPIGELLEYRKRTFLAKKAFKEATRLIPVKVKTHGPIGLLHFGDPHVDDDGTDVVALERHTELCQKTPGLYGCNVGDTRNNWVGNLARLYGEQSTSAMQAVELAEWFLSRVKWLYVIEGNHDVWSGADSPTKWIIQKKGSTLPALMQARIGLNFPNGVQIRVNARHDFSGNSQWNPAHGVMKAAAQGFSDHIFVCGHKHTSGYGILKDSHAGIVSHCIQVASYKVYDRYAEEHGFKDLHVSPCALTILNPDSKTEVGLVQTFFDPEQGADYLNWMRRKWN